MMCISILNFRILYTQVGRAKRIRVERSWSSCDDILSKSIRIAQVAYHLRNCKLR